ncbi:MAG TPA: choice-of-anchor L domain-containing protein, partial [Chitinophagaceae bacterium]|nr:choice-of-anchor L domain-containing protein [Chitinophagaceae bacterium]
MNRVLRFFIFLIVVSVFIPGELIAQMTVTPLQTANQLVDRLVGPGVVYSNPTLTCPSYASGKFDYATATTVAMDSGIVLTTGDATEVNLSAFNSASTNNVFYTSDVDLASAATGSLNDLCKLEFDFVPIGDTIRFNYRFGSDE